MRRGIAEITQLCGGEGAQANKRMSAAVRMEKTSDSDAADSVLMTLGVWGAYLSHVVELYRHMVKQESIHSF